MMTKDDRKRLVGQIMAVLDGFSEDYDRLDKAKTLPTYYATFK